MDTIPPILPITVVVVMVAGYFLYRRYVLLPRAWQRFADDNLLTLEKKGGLKKPEVTGNFHDHPFRLYCFEATGSSTDSSTTYCCIKLIMSPGFVGTLELSHEGIMARLGKAAFKTEDIQLDDMDFDPHYIIKCSNTQLPGQVLKRRTREKLLEFGNWFFNWEGETAQATRMGIEYDGQKLRSIAEILSEVAEELRE